MLSELRIIGHDFTFTQDNYLKYTALVCKKQALSWAPESPDLSPTELLCHELDRKIQKVCSTSRVLCAV